MIKTLLATFLTISLAGYAIMQSASAAQVEHPESHYSLVMISFVNNGNPQAISPTTQTIIGTGYANPDSCGKAAWGAWGTAPGATTPLKKDTDTLRLYFVCVESDK
jgi:cysteine synthase